MDDFISSDDFFLNDFIPNAAHILFRNVLGTKYLDEILFERGQIAEWMEKNWMTSSPAMTFS